MKLVALSLEGYRQFAQKTDIEFPEGLIGISGPNGVGKSKIVEAIGYALFGSRPGILLPKGDSAANLPSSSLPEGTRPRVELVFVFRGQQHTILRHGNRAHVVLGHEEQATTPSGVTGYVQRLLNLTPQTFRGTFLARQREIAGLQDQSSSDRVHLLHQLIGVEQIQGALKAAASVVEERTDAVRAAGIALHTTPEEAEAALHTATARLEQTRSDEGQAREVLSAAKRKEQEANGVLSTLEKRRTRAGQIATELEGLKVQGQQLEDRHTRAAADAANLAEAAAAKQAAEATLRETAKVAQRLHMHEQLACIATWEVARDATANDLSEPIAPGLRRRAAAAEAIARGDRQVDRAQSALTLVKQRIAGATAHLEDIKARMGMLEEQVVNAERLGAAGRCEACGGVLGERLQAVLDHLGGEIGVARGEEQRYVAIRTREQGREQRFLASVERLQQRRTESAAILNDTVALPGEQVAAVRVIEDKRAEIQGARSDLAKEWATAAYDVAAHEADTAASEQRQLAEQTILRLTSLDERAEQTERELKLVLTELGSNQRTRGALTTELAAAAVSAEEQSAAETKSNQASIAAKSAEGTWLAARDEVAVAQEQVRQAELALVEARAKHGVLSAARRELTVAEHCRAVLQQLLAALVGEARPRIEELMNEWLPALLGPSRGLPPSGPNRRESLSVDAVNEARE